MANEVLINCPVCGSLALADKLQVQDKSVSQETFTIQQCQACGFQFTNPRPDAASIGRYYESDAYVSHNSGAQGLINQVYKVARYFTVRRKVALITKLNGGRKGHLLDYGCGTGHFLAGAKQAGWQVTGLEPSDRARQEATERVGQAIQQPEKLAILPAGSFDVVTLWHVLEHVHTLNETLDQLIAALKPQGKLLIAVPNVDSLDAQHYRQNWGRLRRAAPPLPFWTGRHARATGPPWAHYQPETAAHARCLLREYAIGAAPAGRAAGGLLSVLKAGYRSNSYATQHDGQYSSVLYVAERPA